LRLSILIILFLAVLGSSASAQIKVRLFSNQSPESAVFSVSAGKYEISAFNGENLLVSKAEPVLITKYKGKLAVKTRNIKGFLCDSVIISGKTGDDSFSLRINGNNPVRQYYSGDLKCFPDMETLVLINICDVEKYVAGVVLAEGGSGKNIEYFKTQAVIARTYLYKYFDKHITDRYNVCDNTHCQAFNGLSSDTIINNAAMETHGQVIVSQDSTLIISAFHSNCGGETASSEDVWLTSQQYLKSKIDPYCISSRNSVWEKSISRNEWLEFLKKSGYTGNINDSSIFNFDQKPRQVNYKIGLFTIPLRIMRADLNLRSAFFTVISEGDSVIFKGRGYGHGVGLCQEGAMGMAAKGFTYRQIIDFYYTGVLITDIKNAVILSGKPPTPHKGQGQPPKPPIWGA
jgi:stage II sporulation protein D